MDRKAHWEGVYTTKQSGETSWYQPEPERSLELLREVGIDKGTRIIDVGGGDSTLVDALVAQDLATVTILDLSGAALKRARARLGSRAGSVTWIEADVTTALLPPATYDVWHDRAVFHFLTEPDERARYVRAARDAVRPGGTMIIATFAPDGPAKCSGLDVARYSAEALANEFASAFTMRRGFADVHRTPWGAEQRFTFAILQRR